MKAAKYIPNQVEPKWQKLWAKEGFDKGKDFDQKEKFYLLVEFPYPSGAGLHVGHVRSWGAMDVFARQKRMQGKNVLFPMGWDSFGLPAENYAIKTGIHPSVTVPENIANFKRQIKALGLSFDWDRELDTSSPKYYKWTQWIFLKLLEEGLAYQAEVAVNWCPKCKTNLADEEVSADGTHERCGEATEKRLQKQWLLKITKYADRLIEDLEKVDFAPEVATQQINWIGRSEGARIKFKIDGSDEVLEVFTTRPDTLYGVAFMAVSPESAWVKKLTTAKQKEEVEKYLKTVKKNETGKNDKEKTGVFSGSFVINPATKEKVPVWVSDYVLSDYGSGAIMAVPGHDGRDWDFAKKYDLPIKEVILGGEVSKEAFVGEGKITNSDKWNGLEYPKDITKILSDIVSQGWGEKSVGYHLHDWVFSRQHYWGEPIPVIHCQDCGVVPVDQKDLPVELPYLEKFEPAGNGESPLANATDWVNTVCPKCGGKARRETDTMPNWAGSNWYFIRYLDPQNDQSLADNKKMEYWLPVDFYQGGYEHTTLHLLYSRFIYKFLFDIGVVPGPEPYAQRRPHGIVLAKDGRKMSKSWGNVISPDEIINKFGADSLRLYELFMGPFDQTIAWSDEALEGCSRFLGRIYRLFNENLGDKTPSDLAIKLHQTIKKVGSDIENLKFNTAVSAFMEFSNAWNDAGSLGKTDARELTKAMAPFMPHLAEEVWVEILKEPFSVHQQGWPEHDEGIIAQGKITLIIQINGKTRGQLSLELAQSIDQSLVEELTKNQEGIAKWIEKGVKKTIFVPGRLINLVTN